jgi:hypothetical protein
MARRKIKFRDSKDGKDRKDENDNKNSKHFVPFPLLPFIRKWNHYFAGSVNGS